MNEQGATLDVPQPDLPPPERDRDADVGSTPTAPAPIGDFHQWQNERNDDQQSGPDLSSIRVVGPEGPELTSVKKVATTVGIPNDDHNWMRERAMQRLRDDPNDQKAGRVLHAQQVVGLLPDDSPPAHDLPAFDDSVAKVDLGTGVVPTPLRVGHEDQDMDKYLERIRPAAVDATKQRAEKLLAAHRDARISLPPNYLNHLYDIAYEGSTPQTEVDKALKGMGEAKLRGAGEQFVEGAKVAAKGAVRLLRPGEEDDERDNLGEEVVGGVAGGLARMGAAVLKAGTGAIDYARYKTGFYSPQDRKAAIIAGIQMDHDINKSKKVAFPDVDEESPVNQVADFAGAMLMPGFGLEDAVVKPISKLADIAVEKLPAKIGADLTTIGKAGKVLAPGIAAEELYRHGYNPLYAAAALTGYAPFIRHWKFNLMDKAFTGMSDLGTTLAHIPEGTTIVRKLQGDLDKEIEYTRNLEAMKRSEYGDKIKFADEKLANGSKIKTEDLKGPDREVRELQERGDLLQHRRDSLDGAADLNKVLSDAAKLGLSATGLTLATGVGLGALGASGALPSETEEAARKATEAGLGIGAIGSIPMAIHGMNTLRFERGRAAMMDRGETLLTPEQLEGLTPEQQQAAKVMAGFHDVLGKTYSPMDRAAAAKLLNIKPEDMLTPEQLTTMTPEQKQAAVLASVPRGWVQGDTTFVVKDRIPSGVSGHELTHHLQETYGQMLREKDPEAMAAFEKQYQDLLKRSGRAAGSTTQAERDAEVGRILLQQTPIEMFYGGESGGDVIRRRLATFLQERFPGVFDRTRIDPVLGAPYSPSDLQQMRARYVRLGEEAAGMRERTDVPAAGEGRTAIEHSEVTDKVTDAVNRAFKVDSKDKANQSRNRSLVEAAVQDLTDRGESVTEENVFREVMSPKPIAATPEPAAQTTRIAGPALVDENGALIASGKIGDTHVDVMKKAVAQGKEEAINALNNEAQHAFIDTNDEIHNRTSAAKVAVAAKQVPADVTSLQSEHLIQNQQPIPVRHGEFGKEGYTATNEPAPVAEFEKWRQAQQQLAADPLAGLTKQEIAALHRAQERGDIKSEEDLNNWIAQRTSGDRGAKLQAIKQFQESGEPFKVTFTKADGSERVMNAQFGVTEHPDRVKSIEDAQGNKKFMPGGDKPERIELPEFMQGRLTDSDIRKIGKSYGLKYQGDIDGVHSFHDPVSGKDISAVRFMDINQLYDRIDNVRAEAGKKFMPEKEDRPEKRFTEKVAGPAIRVSDIPFTGKTYAEAEEKARAFGFEPNDIKNAERGYLSNKGKWMSPDEASTFASERGQMGEQADAGPLRTQDFNRWRKFMPDDDLIKRAKEHFGTTARFDEAGYILPDGSMLDLTGRHYATGYKEKKPITGQPDYLAGSRNVDHRELGELSEKGGSEGMIDFQNRSGAVRFSHNGGTPHVSVTMRPNPRQLAKILQSAKGADYIAIDIDNPNGDTITGDVIQFPTAGKIKTFFDNEANYRAPKGTSQPSAKFMPSDHPDAITEAALRLPDGIVIEGLTHPHAAQQARQEGYSWDDIAEADAGFVTRKSIFLDRSEAEDHARKIGQIVRPSKVLGVNVDKPSELETVDFERSRKFMPEGFYSQLEKTLEEKMPNRASADQVRGIIAKGAVKKAELDWNSPLRDLLDKGGTLAKEDVMAAVRAGTPELKEVVKSGDADPRNFRLTEGDSELTEDPETGFLTSERRSTITSDETGDTYTVFHDPEADNVSVQRDSDGEWLPIENYAEINSQNISHAYDAIRDDLMNQGVGAGRPTKFSQYQLPGGQNYREILVTLPYEKKGIGELREGESLVDAVDRARADNPVFTSSHFDEPNIVGHLRVNDRKLPNKQKMLFAEEMQSDWAAAGRKEGFARDTKGWTAQSLKEDPGLFTHWLINDANGNYVTEIVGGTKESAIQKAAGDVPDMPWKGNAWQSLLMRSLIKKAVEGGYDSIGWTTGEQQAERYDLSKHIDSLMWAKRKDGTYAITPYKGHDDLTDEIGVPETIQEKDIEKYVGKDIAQKIISGEHDEGGSAGFVAGGELNGVDLKVGGEWATNLYDKQLVNIANDIGKKYGARVQKANIAQAHDASLNQPFENRDRAITVLQRGGEIYGVDQHGHENLIRSIEDLNEQESDGAKFSQFILGDQQPETLVWSMPIPDALREAVKSKGQPLFQPESGARQPAPPLKAKRSRIPAPPLPNQQRKKEQQFAKRYSAFSEIP